MWHKHPVAIFHARIDHNIGPLLERSAAIWKAMASGTWTYVDWTVVCIIELPGRVQSFKALALLQSQLRSQRPRIWLRGSLGQ